MFVGGGGGVTFLSALCFSLSFRLLHFVCNADLLGCSAPVEARRLAGDEAEFGKYSEFDDTLSKFYRVIIIIVITIVMTMIIESDLFCLNFVRPTQRRESMMLISVPTAVFALH